MDGTGESSDEDYWAAIKADNEDQNRAAALATLKEAFEAAKAEESKK